jgi:hypothetical protein
MMATVRRGHVQSGWIFLGWGRGLRTSKICLFSSHQNGYQMARFLSPVDAASKTTTPSGPW